MSDTQARDERVCDDWFGWWICADGDVFPTREEAIEHLQMTRWPETTGRLKCYSAEFEDQDTFEGEWEEVRLDFDRISVPSEGEVS